MADEKGETRRERNERYDVYAPPLIIPDAGRYLWDWYNDIASCVGRVRDGVCYPIPPSEYKAWADVAGHIVNGNEYDILRAMDRSFCDMMNEEFEAYRQRQKDAK